MTTAKAPQDKTTGKAPQDRVASREWAKQHTRFGLCTPDGGDPSWEQACAALAPSVVRARRLYSSKEAGGFAKHSAYAQRVATDGIMTLTSVTPHSNEEPDWAAMKADIATYPEGMAYITNHEFLNPDHARDPMLFSADQLKFKDCLREKDWWMPNINGFAYSAKRGYQATFRNRGGWATVTQELIDAVAGRANTAWSWDCYDGGNYNPGGTPQAGESPGDRMRIGAEWCRKNGITTIAFPEWGTFDDANFADSLAAIKEIDAAPDMRVLAACEWSHVREGMWDKPKIDMLKKAMAS